VVRGVFDEKRGAVFLGGSGDAPAATSSMQAMGVKSCLAAPLLAEDEVVGMVYLEVRLAARVFSEEDLRLVSALANSVAIKLRTIRLTADRRKAEGLQLARDSAEAANRPRARFSRA
jgi:GAF domain-containing protein